MYVIDQYYYVLVVIGIEVVQVQWEVVWVGQVLVFVDVVQFVDGFVGVVDVGFVDLFGGDDGGSDWWECWIIGEV